ncbi:polysaccharide biosynthesis tyrosine autokinase [Flavobacteriaceae bacterium]|nr:polysaccharide biosynthesis tyrosine autokinase [Flavobacteriaceae bacterium]
MNSTNTNFKNIYYKTLTAWPYVIVSIILFVSIAAVINLFSEDVFEVETVLFSQENKNPLASTGVSLAFNLGQDNIMENRVAVASSFSHNLEIAKKIGWEVTYFKKSNYLVDSELYKNAPYKVIFDKTHNQPISILFDIKFKENRFTLNTRDNIDQYIIYNFNNGKAKVVKELDFIDKPFAFNEWITSDVARFKLVPNNDSFERIEGHSFNFVSYESIARKMSKTSTYEVEQYSNILKITSKGNNPKKLADYLNASSNQLKLYELEEKNTMAENTIKFIDDQLLEITESLKLSGSLLETFRSDNLIVDMATESSKTLEQYMTLINQKSEILLERSLLNYIIDFLESKVGYSAMALPSLTGINDPIVNKLTSNIIDQFAKMKGYQFTMSTDNPIYLELEKQIDFTIKNLKFAIENSLDKSTIVLNALEIRTAKIKDKIEQLPIVEQQFANIQREYEANSKQFELLLANRTQAGIAKASNLPDTRVIDKALYKGIKPIGPERIKNLLIAFIIGLFFPSGIIFLKDFLNTKIMNRSEIISLTNIPILAMIPRSDHKSNLAVFERPRSPVAEAFRVLRSKIPYYTNDIDKRGKVIMVTSSIPGEGKTYVSINLASALSLNEEKTILVGLDLRKPKIIEDFGINNNFGVSSYLSGISKNIDEIIQHSGFDNLDIISAGPIPPNPSELINKQIFVEFISLLKEKYKNIIIDTPPIMLVADSLQIAKHVDVTVYMCRYNYTQKELLTFLNEQNDSKALQNIGIVFNDIKDTIGYGYGYGYGYGNTYGKNDS